MLVLSRKKGERLIIGDSIILEIIKSNNGTVKLGISAPKEIPVLREEVYNEINRNKTKKNT